MKYLQFFAVSNVAAVIVERERGRMEVESVGALRERGREMKKENILENLNHRNPALPLIRNLRLPTQAHDLRVFDHGTDHVSQAIGINLGIGIHHEHDLIKIRGNAGDLPQAIEHLELELGHTLVEHDLLQKRHEDDLTVALAAVPRLALVFLVRGAALDDDHHGHALLLGGRDEGMLAVIVEAGVDAGHVVALGAAGDGDVGKGGGPRRAGWRSRASCRGRCRAS